MILNLILIHAFLIIRNKTIRNEHTIDNVHAKTKTAQTAYYSSK